MTPKRWHEFTPQEQEGIYKLYKDTYDKSVGESWPKHTFMGRAKNWTFWGDDKGFVTTRFQNRWQAHKITGSAGSPRSVHQGMKALTSSGQPVWTAATKDIVGGMEKHYGMKALEPDQAKLLAPILQKSGILGDWDLHHVDDEGGMHMNHPTLQHEAVKHMVINDAGLERFTSLGLPVVIKPQTPDVTKAMVETQSPLYNEIGFTNPFGRTYRSAWIHPDGSHEAVPSHASSVISTGETLHQHQGRTGKVAAGLDGGGAYVRFVGSITPEQHKAAGEYLKTAVAYDHSPWWEATDQHSPGKFTGKESSRIPASFVEMCKSWNLGDADVIKAIGDPRYKLPSKMEEGSPEHSQYLKGMSFSVDDPHPDPHGKKFVYEEVENALRAHPELAQQIGHAPQNLWHDDQALMGLMKSGEFGKHWYNGYRNGLTQRAQLSGISPRMLINLFGLNGQGAGLPENISSTLKELARHHAGWYNKGQDHHEMLASMGIRKAASGKPAAWDTLMHVLKGGDLKTKKLGAYGRSFYDPQSNPAIDQWIQRMLIGRGEADKAQNTVKPHVTIAATGRLNHLRDKWNAMHPDQEPVTSPQVQAMLWYGGKHSHADYLESIADTLDMHHPETGASWSGKIRSRAKPIRYDGSWDISSKEHGLDHPEGLPTSNIHHLISSMEPDLMHLYHKGVAHTEFYNWHRVAEGTSPEAIADAVNYVKNTHSKYDSLKSKYVTGHKSVEDGHYLYIPKTSKEGIAELMAQSGVHFDPVKEAGLNGKSTTWVHEAKFKAHMEENPELLSKLGTLHATATRASNEKNPHPYKLIINDMGHGLAELAKRANKIQKGTPMESPVSFNHSVNHVGKLV